MGYTVHFLPENKSIFMEEEENLLKICDRAGILIDAACAGKGVCGKCKVQILKGEVQALTNIEKSTLSEQEISSGIRLACQLKVRDDLSVMMPDVHGSSTRKKSMNQLPDGFVLDPPVKKTFLKLPKATLAEPFSDVEMLAMSLGKEKLSAGTGALRELQKAVSAKRRKITAVTLGERLITAEASDTTELLYGLAFDIGTTTIVGILWNLNNGERVDVEAATNPQSVFGADVISRIQYCIEGEKAGLPHTEDMQKRVIDCFNHMIRLFCQRNSIDSASIYDITVVGNTTMSHLFLGINPASMAKVPFAPVYSGGVSFRASDIGIEINPMARGYVLPNIAGHVGADITAVMIATDLFHIKGNTIVIDIGTNGEILVASEGKVLTCSTAAGPAFEGACISCGMRAARGAIEKVKITDDVYVSTIEDAEPIGICGSGLIDATAMLLSSGLMEENGNLLSQAEAVEKGLSDVLCQRLYGEGPEKGFILAMREEGDPIVLTQKDIREVQLAKGAILGGMLTLMKKMEFCVDEIDQVLIAGAFGSYIDKNSAIRMGLLPQVEEKKVHSIGNGAGVGASMVLLSGEMRDQVEKLVKQITHVELSQDPDFQDYYIESMLF